MLASRSLRQSQSMRRLLSYLAEKSLSGDTDSLKEYTIGVEALHKPSSFSPQEDSSVRVQLGRLRARLAEYFAEEGADDPVRVSLPKGGFGLEFAPLAPTPVSDAAVQSASARWRTAAISIGIACFLLIVAATFNMGRRWAADSESVQLRPGLAKLWAPYVQDRRPTTVVLGVPMFILLGGKDRDYGTATSVLMNPDLTRWPIDTQLPAVAQQEAAEILESFSPEPHFHYVAVGESMGVSLVTKGLAEVGIDSRIVRSNVLSWDDLKNQNVVFVGAPKFNRHLDVAEFMQSFRIGPRAILNLSPYPGEPDVFDRSGEWPEKQAPALIGRYPNKAGGYVTVLASSHSPGSWAAAEYMTAPSYTVALVEALEASYGKVPEYFEAVVDARFEDDHPVSIELLTHRNIEKSTPPGGVAAN